MKRVDRFDHVRIDCVCGHVLQIKLTAKVINTVCKCKLQYMISTPLERVPS